MTLILDLTMMDDGQATVTLDGQVLGTFDPHPLLAQRPLATPDADGLAYGDALYTALHGAAWPADWLMAPAPDPAAILAIRSSDPVLQAIPWEWLRIEGRWAITETLFIRLVPMTERMQAQLAANRPDGTQPYRLVVQCCEPLLWYRDEQWQPLDALPASLLVTPLAQEVQRATPALPVIWHDLAPTMNALLRTIPAHREPLLYHFTGHGDWHDGRPVVLFDDGSGRADPKDMALLSQRLRPRTQLAFVNACHSAEAQGDTASLAFQLCQQGTPVVIGMDGPVEDRHGQQWATDFYPSLLRGSDPPTALWDARLAMQDRERHHPAAWVQPVLYVADGYQWQPSTGTVPAPLPAVRIVPPVISDLQVAQRGFIGRRTELIEVADLVAQHPVVTVRGAGGMGKTALVAALAQRLAWRFRDGVYAYSFANQPSPDLMSVLRWCAGWLGLALDPAWQDADVQQQVIQQLRGKACLLVVDNYETILWALGRQDEGLDLWADADPADSAAEPRNERQQAAHAIQTFWEQVASLGIKVVFTTRHSPVRLEGIAEACYPSDDRIGQLQGLAEADAVALFERWCGGTALPHDPPPRGIVLQIVRLIGAIPLVIQLTARRWATLPNPQPDQFLTDLHTHLVAAQTMDGARHQQSLVVNVRLSVDALAPTMQAALFQLSLLENPLIWGLNAAAIWGLTTETEEGICYETDPAIARLHQLEATSLIQVVAAEQDVFGFQPALLQTLRYLRDHPPLRERMTTPMQDAQTRYGHYAWLTTKDYARQQEAGMLTKEAQAKFPDLLAGRQYLEPAQTGWVAYWVADIQRQFGLLGDAQRLHEEALQIAKSYKLLTLQSNVTYALASIHQIHGAYEEAEELYRESLALDDDLDDLQGRAANLHELATLAQLRGEYRDAEQLYRESLATHDMMSERESPFFTMYALAQIDAVRRAYEDAERLYHESLAIHDEPVTLAQLRGEYENAERLYRESLATYNAVSKRQHAATLNALAQIAVVRGSYEDAERLYCESLAIHDALGNRKSRAATLYGLAHIFIVRGAYEDAEGLYRESLAIADDLGDLQGRAAILHELATLARVRGEYRDAERLCYESLAIDDALGDRKSRASTLHELANLAQLQDMYGKAEEFYYESLAIKDALGDRKGRADTLHELATLARVRGMYEKAKELYCESLTIYDDLDNRQGRADTLNALGRVAVVLGAYEHAEELYRESLMIYNDLGNRKGQADTIHGFANLAQLRGVYDDAEGLYRESLVIYNDLGDRKGRADTLNALAQVAVVRGAYEHAEELYRESLAVTEALDDHKGRVSTLNALAQISVVRGSYKDAERLYRESLAITDMLDDSYAKARITVMLGQLLLKQGSNIGTTMIEQAYEIFHQLGAANDAEQTKTILELVQHPTLIECINQWMTSAREATGLTTLLNRVCQTVVAVMKTTDPEARQQVVEHLEPLVATDSLPIDGAMSFLQTLQAWLRGDETQWQTLLPQLNDRFQSVITQMQLAVHPIYRQVMPLLWATADALHRNDPAVTDQLVARLSTMSDQAAEGEPEDSPWMDAARALRAARAILQGDAIETTGLGEIYQAMLGQLHAIAANRPLV